MEKFKFPRKFTLVDIPEWKKFQDNNPGSEIDEKICAITYGRAIHWMSFLQILWPDFEHIDYYALDVGYIVANDPDEDHLPEEWFLQMAHTIAAFWRIQLTNLYPNGDWEVEVEEEKPELTTYAIIRHYG